MTRRITWAAVNSLFVYHSCIAQGCYCERLNMWSSHCRTVRKEPKTTIFPQKTSIIFDSEESLFQDNSAKDHLKESIEQLQNYVWKVAQKVFFHCHTLCKKLAATSHPLEHWKEDSWQEQSRQVKMSKTGKQTTTQRENERKKNWETWLLLRLI